MNEGIEERKSRVLDTYVSDQRYNIERFIDNFRYMNQTHFASDDMAVHEIVSDLKRMGILIEPRQVSQIITKNMETGIEEFRAQCLRTNQKYLDGQKRDGLNDEFMEGKHNYEKEVNILFDSLYDREDTYLRNNPFFKDA